MFVICPILYLSTCSYITEKRSAAYHTVNIGDTEANVIDKFAADPIREKQGVLFSRYSSSICQAPCVERLWFENRLTLDTEAWWTEFGIDGRAIDKGYVVSP